MDQLDHQIAKLDTQRQAAIFKGRQLQVQLAEAKSEVAALATQVAAQSQSSQSSATSDRGEEWKRAANTVWGKIPADHPHRGFAAELFKELFGQMRGEFAQMAAMQMPGDLRDPQVGVGLPMLGDGRRDGPTGTKRARVGADGASEFDEFELGFGDRMELPDEACDDVFRGRLAEAQEAHEQQVQAAMAAFAGAGDESDRLRG